ncbi:MAG: hypothetical protein H0W44_05975 [Gammaproteobacteria bacterium]|nr:hypothetical protein [Gammaproteobacteria bacterium]
MIKKMTKLLLNVVIGKSYISAVIFFPLNIIKLRWPIAQPLSKIVCNIRALLSITTLNYGDLPCLERSQLSYWLFGSPGFFYPTNRPIVLFVKKLISVRCMSFFLAHAQRLYVAAFPTAPVESCDLLLMLPIQQPPRAYFEYLSRFRSRYTLYIDRGFQLKPAMTHPNATSYL